MELKTLKDMGEQKYYEVDIIQGDLAKPGPHTKKRYVSACSKEELKQEAIKWVKDNLNKAHKKGIKQNLYEYYKGKADGIAELNNITEEDLK